MKDIKTSESNHMTTCNLNVKTDACEKISSLKTHEK